MVKFKEKRDENKEKGNEVRNSTKLPALGLQRHCNVSNGRH